MTHGTTLSDSKPTNTKPVKVAEIQQSGRAPQGPGRSTTGVINSRAVADYKVLSTRG